MIDTTASGASRRRNGRGPAVSIVIPAYEASPFIETALGSVRRQTLDDYEAIVVNDGSSPPETEALRRILADYDDRFIYAERENGGEGLARNTALSLARGRYVALLDADDWWEPNLLAEQVGFLERSRAVSLVYADARLFGDTPDAGRTFMDFEPSTGEVTLESLLSRRCVVLMSTIVAHREAIERAGRFEPLRWLADYNLWLRMARCGERLAYQRKVLAHRRVHRNSLSANVIRMKLAMIEELQKVASGGPLTAAEAAALSASVSWTRAELAVERAKQSLSRRDFAEASDALRAVERHHMSVRRKLALAGLRLAPYAVWAAYVLRDRILHDED